MHVRHILYGLAAVVALIGAACAADATLSDNLDTQSLDRAAVPQWEEPGAEPDPERDPDALDAGSDAGADAGRDAGGDAGDDAGDAGGDAGDVGDAGDAAASGQEPDVTPAST
jgi:hypothetical protein